MQTVDVIFKKPFNAIPTIVCTLKSGSNITTYGDLTAFVDYGSVTKKGFTIKVSNSCATLGAKPCVSWIATVLWNSNLQTSVNSSNVNDVHTGFSIIRWNSSTLNTTTSEKITKASCGIIISFTESNDWGVQLSMQAGNNNFCYRTKSGTWSDWKTLMK